MLIGICGKKQNGKDTIANYLVNKRSFIKHSFAKPLKEACKVIFNFSDEQVHGNLKEIVDERWNETPRKILQLVGTELFRNTLPKYCKDIGDNIWLKNFEMWYKENSDKNIVICDCRFLNELKLIEKLSGIIILVERNSLNNNVDTHPSENEFLLYDKFDYVINNDSSFEDLYKKIDKLFEV